MPASRAEIFVENRAQPQADIAGVVRLKGLDAPEEPCKTTSYKSTEADSVSSICLGRIGIGEPAASINEAVTRSLGAPRYASGGTAMFTPKVAKPQTKATEGPTSRPTQQLSTHAGHGLARDPVKQLRFLQRTIGNQATQQLRTQMAPRPDQEVAPENETTSRAGRGLDWDFSKMPLFPPGRASQYEPSLRVTEAPLPGVVQAKPPVGSVDDQLKSAGDQHGRQGDAGANIVVEGFAGASEQRSAPAEREADKGSPSQRPVPRTQVPQTAFNRPRASVASGRSVNWSSQRSAGGAIARIGLAASHPQGVSWSALQTLPKDGAALISGPPGPTTLSSVWAGGGNGAAGYTDWPAGYKAPDFAFNTTSTPPPPVATPDAGAPAPPQWTARPTATTAAFEGTSGSFYTDAGKYKTGNQEGGKDVYWNFSAGISALVKTGEQEHCDDFAEAYRISLKEADTIIKANIDGKAFGPKASKPEAEQLVLAEITAKLSHPQLGNDKTQWAAKYNTLFTKTLTRDTSAWHSISLGTRSVDAAGNVIYEVVKGTANIPGPAPNSIIKY